MEKMVGICLEAPLGGSPNLNTILLDPLQNVSTSWEIDPSPPDSTRACGETTAPPATRSIGLTPLENKFYHQARTEAEQRMVMRNDLRNDLRDGGGNGTTPAQPPVHRAQRPEPPGSKKNDQHNENQPIIEVEVEIDNHIM